MSFKVEGLKELEKLLVELGARAGKKVLKGALTDAAKPIRKATRAAAPKSSGNLRKQIKTQVFVGKGKRSDVVTAMVGTFKNGKKNAGFYARFLEYGTKKHAIPSPNVGRGKNKRKNKAVVAFGGKVYGKVIHPGQRAKPFMLQAFNQTHKEALRILALRIRQRIILESIKKYGRNRN